MILPVLKSTFFWLEGLKDHSIVFMESYRLVYLTLLDLLGKEDEEGIELLSQI